MKRNDLFGLDKSLRDIAAELYNGLENNNWRNWCSEYMEYGKRTPLVLLVLPYNTGLIQRLIMAEGKSGVIPYLTHLATELNQENVGFPDFYVYNLEGMTYIETGVPVYS